MKLRMMIVTLLLVTLALPAAAQRRYRQDTNWHSSRPSPFQVVIEGAAAIPQGDLGDDFIGTDKGMGATTGYEFGGRLRFQGSIPKVNE